MLNPVARLVSRGFLVSRFVSLRESCDLLDFGTVKCRRPIAVRRDADMLVGDGNRAVLTTRVGQAGREW